MNKLYKTNLYKKFDFPLTDLSFAETQRRHLCMRNERKIYNRKCDATGEDIISIYSLDKPFKVYKADYWYGDKWDATTYGRDFDFNKTLFEQFAALQLNVPRLALVNARGENSDYCNMTIGNKNCYLLFGSDFNRDCMYGTLCMRNSFSLDIDYSDQNELCYELYNSHNCYGCQFTVDSKNCNNCYFVSDCVGCTECILCSNLVQRSYSIGNKEYSKEKYFEKKKVLINGTLSGLKELWQKFLALRSERIVKYAHSIKCQNCTGDYLKNSKNCLNCFDTTASEDMKNIIFATRSKNCLDCTLLGEQTEYCYNTISTSGAHKVHFSFAVLDSLNVEYSKMVFDSKNIFASTALRNKKNCILNKQYSEADYHKLRDRIITHMKKTGEWGQFFPPEISDFCYNETSAHNYFPLTKKEATKQGYSWKEDEEKTFQPQTIKVPDDVGEVEESIIKETLQCVNCQKNYKILPQEYEFYKKSLIPIPDFCEACRNQRRTQMRNPRELWNRECQKCGASFETTYSPERPEKIYCEKCYQEEFYK